MQSYYVSFGWGHSHVIRGKTYDKDTIAVVDADDYGKARDIAFEAFGRQFCTVYAEMPDMRHYPGGFVRLD